MSYRAKQVCRAIPSDKELTVLTKEACNEVAGKSYRLTSRLVYAAEMAWLMQTVILFVKSLKGLSHTKEEDTSEEDLELSVQALYRLAVRTIDWAANRA